MTTGPAIDRLSVEQVSVVRDGRAVLREVSLDVMPGQVLGIIGRNGAGKTTLLRAMAGLQALASGTIRLNGIELAALDRRVRAQRLAYLEQSGAGAWPIASRDLVALGRLPYRAWPARPDLDDGAAITAALTASDAMQFADRPIDTLSSGERARVLLARALAGQPQVLLADEPVAALDPGHQLGVMGMLRRQAAAGMAVVVVLHDLALAARFCDRLALLGESGLLAAGLPADVMSDALLARAFAIRALRGTQDAESWVLPWREVEP